MSLNFFMKLLITLMKNNKLILVSPLPPPYGGIARWTEQIVSYLTDHSIIEYKHLDIAVRWRSVHSNALIRAFGGVIQLFFNYLNFLFILISGFNIVHLTSSGSFGLFRDVLFCLTSKVLMRKFIIHIRFGRISQIFNQKNYEYYLLSFIFKLSDCIICIDENTYDFLANHHQYLNKVKLIPNCIDYNFNDDSSIKNQKDNIISFVGWIKREKGVEELIAAFLKLASEKWTLNLIGPIDIVFFDYLNTQYSLSTKSNINFLGSLNNNSVINELVKSKVFSLPSYTEGFPNVVLEAMATKNAIVATNVGAIPEMLASRAGFLVSVANVTELSDALKSILDDPALQLELANNAFNRCKDFYSIEKIVNQYFDIWTSLEKK